MPRRKATPMKRLAHTWEKAPQIMETEYAALLLGLNPDTLRRMARRGDVPAKKIGPRLWRFDKTVLKAWVESSNN